MIRVFSFYANWRDENCVRLERIVPKSGWIEPFGTSPPCGNAAPSRPFLLSRLLPADERQHLGLDSAEG
jgi:hypothetical protein